MFGQVQYFFLVVFRQVVSPLLLVALVHGYKLLFGGRWAPVLGRVEVVRLGKTLVLQIPNVILDLVQRIKHLFPKLLIRFLIRPTPLDGVADLLYRRCILP